MRLEQYLEDSAESRAGHPPLPLSRRGEQRRRLGCASRPEVRGRRLLQRLPQSPAHPRHRDGGIASLSRCRTHHNVAVKEKAICPVLALQLSSRNVHFVGRMHGSRSNEHLPAGTHNESVMHRTESTRENNLIELFCASLQIFTSPKRI